MCHNIPVTVERDIQPAPSITPATGSDRREVASQPQGGFIDLSREDHSMTGPGTIPTDTATNGAPSVKSAKPQTIREFERALQTLGFSQRESKAVASGGFKAIHPTEQLSEQLQALAAAIAKHQFIFEEHPHDNNS